MLLLKLKH